jgi:hypothetical protein
VRFRAKFGLLGWCWVGLASFVVVLWISGLRSRALGGLAIGCVLLASERVLVQRFIYWDVDDDGLRERRLWKKKEVAWRNVRHVGAWNPKQPASDYLAIDFTRSAPAPGRSRIIANPEDRAAFIAALRRFAPQAAFDV